MEEKTTSIGLDFESMQTIKFDPVSEDIWSEQKVVFYCSVCKKLVEPKRSGKSLKFFCSECGSERVAYGTEKSIINYFRIKKID